MEYVVLLRGVTPTGKNRIPKMSYLIEILEEVGFRNVRTYIQSGNIVLNTDFSQEETVDLIHETIAQKIGAKLNIIIKTKKELKKAVKENPFDETYDYSRIHLVFTNDDIDSAKLKKIENTNFDTEKFVVGSESLYIYLPKNAVKKKLNTNYLEGKLSIVATMRKINVINQLINL